MCKCNMLVNVYELDISVKRHILVLQQLQNLGCLIDKKPNSVKVTHYNTKEKEGHGQNMLSS